MEAFQGIEQKIAEYVSRAPGVIALPDDAEDSRMTGAVVELLRRSLMETVILFGSVRRGGGLWRLLQRYPSHVLLAEELCPDMSAQLAERLRLAAKYCEEQIAGISCNPYWQAGWLLESGHCHSALAGLSVPTAEVIRAVLGTTGLADGIRTLSGSFLMVREPELFVFADCGVVVRPDPEQLVDIARESVRTFEMLNGEGKIPRVAFLSFSTKGSARHPEALRMQEAARLFRKICPEICSDGELQFDAAYSWDVGKRKASGSAVAGRANVLIFPDLNAGNLAYKIAEKLGGFSAYGPILQGSRKVYSDLSRGASVRDVVVASMLNALRSGLCSAEVAA
ncbi:MAG: hypothetical protein H6618_08285 [Deltaproteobacteria bacterium]|nr:hypothetical protein [Deltaproteobacteria bacterium]